MDILPQLGTTPSPAFKNTKWCHDLKVEEYKFNMQTFLETKLYFPPKELENEHLRVKGFIFFARNNDDQIFRETESEIDEIFSYFSQDNLDNYNRSNQLKKQGKTYCKTEFEKILKALFMDMTWPLDFSCRNSKNHYYKVFEQFTTKLPTKWKNYMNEWYRSEINNFFAYIDNLTLTVGHYTVDMKTFFEKNVCVETPIFDRTHTIFFEKAQAQLADKSIHCNWTDSTENCLNSCKSKMHETIETIRELFRKDNLVALKQENEIISQAFSHAEKTYNQTMATKMKMSESKPQLTKAEIQEFHKLCKTAVVVSFAKGSDFTYSSLWQIEQINLEKSLEKLLSNHLGDKGGDKPRPMVKNKVHIDQLNNSVVTASTQAPSFRHHSRVNNANTITSETNIPVEKRYGLGIFIGPEIVRVALYKVKSKTPIYLKCSPFIAFNNTNILYFKEAEDSVENFNIFKLLEVAMKEPRSVLISNQPLNLRTEEIVGLFLNQIRLEAVQVAQQDLKSCVATVTALWSISSKQMLKNSLFLAGFENSQLIQSTTSIGLSYLHNLQAYQTQGNNNNFYVALIHQTPHGFDVAVAGISGRALKIKKLYANENVEGGSGSDLGWFNPLRLLPDRILKYIVNTEVDDDDDDDSLGKLRKILSSLLTASEVKEKQLQHVVFIKNKSQEEPMLENQTLNNNCKLFSVSKSSTFMVLDEQEGLVLGAAVLNATSNGNLDVKDFKFQEVFPYTVITKENDQPFCNILVINNASLISTNCQIPAADGKASRTLTISELFGENAVIIGEYFVEMYTSKMGKQRFNVDLTCEGLVDVQLQPVKGAMPAKLGLQTSFLTLKKLQDARVNISTILSLVKGKQN